MSTVYKCTGIYAVLDWHENGKQPTSSASGCLLVATKTLVCSPATRKNQE